MQLNQTTRNQQLPPCRDEYKCLLQYEHPSEHNARYSHPCRWAELCRDVNQNSEHARQFTHHPHQGTPCKFGADQCTKLTDPEHRRAYRHQGLPDFLMPCRYREQCRERSSVEHLKRFEHPSTLNQTTQNMMSETTSSQNTSRLSQKACRYGDDCRQKSDPRHCHHYSHPPSDGSNQLLSTATRLTVSSCGDDMQRAYRIGGALALEKLSKSDRTAIENMPADTIIVVPGAHDHIDRVLDNLNIKYKTLQKSEVATYPFRNDQTVYINCDLNFPVEAARQLRQHVENGLHIITTDWALRSVLEVAFFDFIKHNGQSTRDEVVGIDVVDSSHPLVNGFLPACQHAQPQWWLETGSHPIEIVNKGQVRVLIRSAELGEKYRSDAVLVTFNCKQGNVIHMISHFYLQRSETRGARHSMSAKQYAVDTNASKAVTSLVENQGQNLNYAQIQSSSTSAQFIYNQIATRLNTTKK